MPTFTFTTEVYKGRYETPYEVEATYQVNSDGEVEVTDAKCAVYLTDEDFDHLHDIACDSADADMADWAADYGDWLYEQRRDRAAESYIPGGAL